ESRRRARGALLPDRRRDHRGGSDRSCGRVSSGRVRCPTCARTYPASERFCECGMPLVQDAGAAAERSPAQLQARKIKPQYTEGKPVLVARARNLAEAEFLSGLLLEEG